MAVQPILDQSTISGGINYSPNVVEGNIVSGPINYISSETDSNNAIAGSLLGAPLVPGLRITVKLAHSLQVGANTFNLNSGGGVSIKSLRTLANIGVGYSSTGTIVLQYDGTEWLDLSQ